MAPAFNADACFQIRSRFPIVSGESLGVYVPTRRKRPKTAHMSELKEAADRLASALADVDEEELVADFKELRRRGKGASR